MKKYVLIFGIKRLGSDIAKHFASLGFDLILVYNKSEKEATSLQKDIIEKFSCEVILKQADLTKKDHIESLFSEILDKKIEIICHLASEIKFDDLSSDDIIENLYNSLDIHAISLFQIAKFVRKNKIICDIFAFIDSDLKYKTKHLSYSIGKKVLHEMISFLAPQLENIARINGISPSLISEYPMLDQKSKATEVIDQKKLTKYDIKIENIINTIDFLLQNKCINGQIFNINQGSNIS